MIQTTPVEALINWYKTLPLARKYEFAQFIVNYAPNLVNEENSFSTIPPQEYSQISSKFQKWLESYKDKEKINVVGLILCLRAIISFQIRNWGNPFDEIFYKSVSIASSALQNLRKMKDVDEEESKKFLDSMNYVISSTILESTEIKKSWDDLCRKDLSDELIYSWFHSSSNSI